VRADGSQPADEAVLGTAASDSAREGAAAPRVMVVCEGLSSQESRGHLDARRACEAADGQSEADGARGAGSPSEFPN
jgi:hypothetical protein